MFFVGIIALCLFLIFYFTGKEDSKNKITQNEVVFNNQNNFYYNNSIQKKEYKNNFNIILNLGVFLIILSSIIFATSTWKIYSNNIKVLILAIETILFLVFGLILKYVFKVTKSGNALTFISSMLFLATYLSFGYFKIFGNDFSLFGKLSDIFLSTAFLSTAIIFLIRKLLLKSNKYFILIASFFLGLFFLIKGVSDSYIFAFALTMLVITLINLFKKDIFNNVKEFNIFNIIVSIGFTFSYLYLCIYQLISGNLFFLQRFSLIILIASLFFNFVIFNGKKNEALSILSVLYELLLVGWFTLFSGSLIVSSFTLIISSLILFIFYYISKDDYLKTTSIIISYLQGLFGIILICFEKDYILTAPIIAFIYIIITFISSLKKDKLLILNSIFEPIYLVMFAIGILIQPAIINNIKPIDIIMVINVCLIIAMIAATILKNNIKNGYFILIMIGLFIQIICSCYAVIIYSIIALMINFILFVYTLISKDLFYKKCSFALTLLFIINCIIGLNKYQLLGALIIFLSLILFVLLNKQSNKKYVYLSLFCIPFIILINNIGLRISYAKDLTIIILVPSIILLVRKFICPNDETGMNIIELIIFTIISFIIRNNIFLLLFLIILYIASYLLKNKFEKSSKVYLNYLLFFTAATFYMIRTGKYEALYMIAIFSILIINQVLYILLFEKRKNTFEIFHSLLSLVLIISLIGNLNFNNIVSAIISAILILILYLIYIGQKTRYIVISFIIYPIMLLLNYINIPYSINIIKTFIWIIPIVVFIRKVLKLNEESSIIIESTILSLMFLSFLFIVDVYVGVTLGIISVILIILGLLLKYKSFTYVGYISLVFVIIIQTIYLWSSMPWWVYLLLAGIVLVVLAAIKESKKK